MTWSCHNKCRSNDFNEISEDLGEWIWHISWSKTVNWKVYDHVLPGRRLNLALIRHFVDFLGGKQPASTELLIPVSRLGHWHNGFDPNNITRYILIMSVRLHDDDDETLLACSIQKTWFIPFLNFFTFSFDFWLTLYENYIEPVEWNLPRSPFWRQSNYQLRRSFQGLDTKRAKKIINLNHVDEISSDLFNQKNKNHITLTIIFFKSHNTREVH